MPGLLTASQTASITATVASSLDVSLPLYRKVAASDGYGHSTETWGATPTNMIACNVMKATATVLQAYALIIGSKRAAILRVMQTTDVREGDRVAYDGLNWLVQERMNAESYTVTNQYLMTVVI